MARIMLAVFLMALVTYIPRVLPLVFLKNKLESRFWRSFLYYVPYAALGAMTFPKVIYSTGHLYSALFGTLVALILAYLEKGLMTVAVSAIVTVYVVELLM